ncbi:hypothetical protein DFS33DRAFT_1385649 [Desarmillaria ectypa]|nr:hypothetical protein DFS33DRAFT_1385649 [Desarmillaria ectypa]
MTQRNIFFAAYAWLDLMSFFTDTERILEHILVSARNAWDHAPGCSPWVWYRASCGKDKCERRRFAQHDTGECGGVGLQKSDLELVQSSLLGGLLSNILLVLGMAFLMGPAEQEFHPMVAPVNSSLMMAAVVAMTVICRLCIHT